MRGSWIRFTMFALIVGLALAATPVEAQETRSVLRGTVVDSTGGGLPGVQVDAEGPLGILTDITDAEGAYRFPRVVPGEYQITARLEGFQDAVAGGVRVTLGEASTVDFTMQEEFGEEIVVYPDTVAIDFTESQTATSINKYEIDLLPRGRDFTEVVSFAAGTVLDNQAGGISIDGASGLENRYVIDGIDTTDPQIGDSAVPMRAEFFEEVQVKSAGYASEFGGSTGGVINAVTRSGGNDWHGSLFLDYENEDLNGRARKELENDGLLYRYDKDDEVRYDPGFSLSGPIVRDRLWFFASYQPGFRTRERTVDWPSYDADTYRSDFDIDYAVANVTANIGSKVLLKIGGNISPYTTDGFLPNPDGKADLPDQENYAPLGTKGERETYSMNVDWIASENIVVAGRVGYYHTNVEDTGIPTFDLIHNYSTSNSQAMLDILPPEYRNSAGWFSDNLQNADQYDIYERTSGAIDSTFYFRGAGDHAVKVGFQTERIENDVLSGYNADRILYYFDRSYTTTSGESVRGEYGYFRLLRIATSGQAETNNDALFVQDTWNVTPNFTLNVGVRAEEENIPNFGATGPDPAISFGYGDKIAPRLGFAWDIFGDAKWKAYGSYGVYYDVTKYEMPRGSFGGDRWVDFWFTADDPNYNLNDPATGCSTGDNSINHVPTCGAGTLIEAVNRRFNSADPAYEDLFGYPAVDPDLKPMESWEFQLGVDHQLTPTIQLGARYVHKEITRAIEDVGFLYPGIGEVYIIANPGEGIVAAPDDDGLVYPKPRRDYDALELTMEKRFSDNWSLRAYYTLSRLYGNYSGLANSDEQNSVGSPRNPAGTSARLSPNVSRLYDTITSMYDADGNHVFGELATNRTHQLGAQFLYDFDFGLSVGVTQYIGSGTPVSEIATVPIHSFFYPLGRGNLGETDWLYQTDLSLWQRFKIKDYAFSIGLTVLNLFDTETATRVWGTRTLDDLVVTNADFATGFDYQAAVANPDVAIDPRYGVEDTYQGAREVRLTVKFEF